MEDTLKHPGSPNWPHWPPSSCCCFFGLGLIEDVVRDRQHYRSMTAQSVASSLAGPQTLMGH